MKFNLTRNCEIEIEKNFFDDIKVKLMSFDLELRCWVESTDLFQIKCEDIEMLSRIADVECIPVNILIYKIKDVVLDFAQADRGLRELKRENWRRIKNERIKNELI